MDNTESRILFVNPCLPTLPKEVVSTPFGPAWMSTELKKHGFKVDAFDMQVEPSFDKLAGALKQKPLLVGVPHMSNFSMGWSGRVVDFIQKQLPDTLIVAGGVGATYENERALKRNKVSVVVMGEGEKTMVELAQAAKSTRGILTASDFREIDGLAFLDGEEVRFSGQRSAITDLDSLGLPDRSIYKLGLYPQGSILTSRGCSHACAYCSSADYWGNVTGKTNPRVRLRSTEGIIEEIQELKSKYHIDNFYILDDVFTFNRARVMDLCQEIQDRSLNVHWACLARGDQVDPEMLQQMKKAGCTQVHYGLESADNESLKRAGKGITAEQIGNAIDWTKDAGMRARTSVIFGMPGDTTTEITKTIEFLKHHRPNEVQIYSLMPYPGSRWGDQPENFGIHITEPDSNRRIQSTYESFAETDLLPTTKIQQLATQAVSDLESCGYIHLTGKEAKLKGNHEFVVSTAFTPIQALDQYSNVSSYQDIIEAGPIQYD